MAKKLVQHPELETPRLRLRQFSLDDVQALHEVLSNADAVRFWDQPIHTKKSDTERSVRNWIDCTPAYYRIWAVADRTNNQCIGQVNCHDGHIRNKRATIGYILNPRYQRQGLASEAVSALLTYCFDQMGFHRLQAYVHPQNTPSRKLAENMGFRAEGVLRDNLRVGDEWRDDVLYALLAGERGR
jgi:ribosomal-protein-alanine N-acetyltransferase